MKEVALKLGIALDNDNQITSRAAIKDELFNKHDFGIKMMFG